MWAKNTTVYVPEYIAIEFMPNFYHRWKRFLIVFTMHKTRMQNSFKAICTTTRHGLYTTLKESLFEILASIFAITTDLWTSRVVKGYLTVIVHYITSDWKLKNKVLQTH